MEEFNWDFNASQSQAPQTDNFDWAFEGQPAPLTQQTEPSKSTPEVASQDSGLADMFDQKVDLNQDEPATPTDHTINPLKIEGINDSPLKKHGHEEPAAQDENPGFVTPKDHMIDAMNNDNLLDSPDRKNKKEPAQQ